MIFLIIARISLSKTSMSSLLTCGRIFISEVYSILVSVGLLKYILKPLIQHRRTIYQHRCAVLILLGAKIEFVFEILFVGIDL